MTTDGGEIGGTSEKQFIGKDPLALNPHTTPYYQLEPTDRLDISPGGADSMDNQGGQPPREDGTATRPRAGDEITPESTMEETVRTTSPPQIAGSHEQNNERERAKKNDNKAARKQPPCGGDNEQHVHSAMAIGQDNIVADGLSRHKDCSEGEGITGSGTDTESHTTPGIDRAAINQPSSDNGWGRVRPDFADLQGGVELQTWTVATHIFGERTLPQGG